MAIGHEGEFIAIPNRRTVRIRFFRTEDILSFSTVFSNHELHEMEQTHRNWMIEESQMITLSSGRP
jgi:hypothetical protein